MTTQPPRARSFGTVAADYARLRPDYPAVAVEWALAPTPGKVVLDLGAGTGKLTATLVTLPGVTITAVDPDPAMLAELRALLPDVRALEGSAESIPLPDASVDAVVAGQAWHWFEPELAYPEIARVLRPGGVLAGLWNADDPNVEWLVGMHNAGVEGRPVPSNIRAGDNSMMPEHPLFAPAERALFPHVHPLSGVEALIDVLRTHSWALMSEPADREAAFTRIRAYLATRPEVSPDGFDLPLVTTVLRAVRR
ncbi:class I SAM-dependent methyltransferase [Pseudonocardia sp. TRM90224]|uniref:class I SAM-dependent methyltransferase n=1 Tax=Pseudonocardia sp. TRM90224 TaxID=2812678 RepID=UPI001E544274|nr:class I SAM-dependent methyltransferase [Pseudonocardia sp. TRM90224]